MTHWSVECWPNSFFRWKINEKYYGSPRALLVCRQNPQIQLFHRKNQRNKEWFENSLDENKIRCLHFGRFYWITTLEFWFVFLLLHRFSVCVVVCVLFFVVVALWVSSFCSLHQCGKHTFLPFLLFGFCSMVSCISHKAM